MISAAFMGYTLWRIRMPSPDPHPRMIEDPKGFAYDYITANAIVRALYETYVRMYYLCVEPVTPEVRSLRLDVWERHGIATSKRLAATFKDPTPIEDERIAELDAAIAASPHAGLLGTKDRESQSAIRLHGLLEPVRIAAIRAGIPKETWDFLYALKSNFSHPSAFSTLKQQQMLARDDQRAALDAGVEVAAAVLRGCPVLAGLIMAYSAIVPEVTALLDETDFWLCELHHRMLGEKLGSLSA